MMFRAVNVWRRVSENTAVCYRCFELLNGGGFCVQSKDVCRLPVDEPARRLLERQFLELLCEESPDARSGVYPTLLKAIQAFDEDFEAPCNGKPMSDLEAATLAVSKAKGRVMHVRGRRSAVEKKEGAVAAHASKR
jgi:hypothetical protein